MLRLEGADASPCLFPLTIRSTVPQFRMTNNSPTDKSKWKKQSFQNSILKQDRHRNERSPINASVIKQENMLNLNKKSKSKLEPLLVEKRQIFLTPEVD